MIAALMVLALGAEPASEPASFAASLPASAPASEPASAPASHASFETIVTGTRQRRATQQKHFAKEQVAHVPGGFGDPIRQMQTMPGVAILPLLNGQLIVRGTRSGDTAFFIDGMPVPYVFHFGSGFGPSVFPSLLIEDITFTPSLPSPRYGGMLGGTVELKTRDRFEQWVHGTVAVDLLAAQAHLYVAPTPYFAFEGSVRRSYIEGIAAIVTPIIPDRIPAVIPYFTDYQAHVALRSERAGHFDLWFYGSDDGFSLVGGNAFADQVRQLESFLQKTSFNAWKPRWRLRINDHLEHETTVLLNYVLAPQGLSPNIQWQLGIRDELTIRFSQRSSLRVGIDTLSTWQTPSGPQLIQPAPEGYEAHRLSLYGDADLSFGRVDIKGGARLTLWQLGFRLLTPPGFGSLAVVEEPAPVFLQALEPRATIGVKVHEQVRLSLGSGLYQAPLPFSAWVPVIGPSIRLQRVDPRNLRINSFTLSYDRTQLTTMEQNWQSVASVQWQALPWLSVEVNGFFNWMRHVTISRIFGTPSPSELRDRLERRGYGAELFVRAQSIHGFSGWISYTLSHTEDVQDGRAVPSDYSQTHVIGLSLAYALPYDINIGLRFRLGSGWPVTPIIASRFDLTTDQYYGEIGPRNSGRTPVVHQLDLRFDKMFRFKKWSLSLYLEVLNVYAQKNPEYDYIPWDFSGTRYISVIPILPMFGLSAEF